MCFAGYDMARLARSEISSPDEMTHLHLMARVVRRCYLPGDDPITGKNYDHRKALIEEQLTRLAACMGTDLLGFSILSNHFHLGEKPARCRGHLRRTSKNCRLIQTFYRFVSGLPKLSDSTP